MKPLGRIIVPTIIPERLKRLSDIAHNFWWTWNCEAVELYRSIDPALWDKTGANPAAFIRRIGSRKLEQLLNDAAFLKAYDNIVSRFDDYMNDTNTWFNNKFPDKKERMIAYFSAEYGLNETLPIYSGGLGVLSGDHCKSASDLGLPFTAVGLFYRQGYFNQVINCEGTQETSYSTLNIDELAIEPVVDDGGNKLVISVEMPGRNVYASVWLVRVGRVKLYLLDSDVLSNSEQDRGITARLYGGDGETRIQQEILLGIGGVRALDALGINPSVYHMNEGHSAFMGFELIRKWMQTHNLSFREAREMVHSASVFTIHTPVPAGIDVFGHDLMDKYFTSFRENLGISREDFLSLGTDKWNPYGFNMASMAMTMASKRNGVSKLHGAVTRRMFGSLWPGVPEKEVPVTHVTNGIHTTTWLSEAYRKLFDKYLAGGWAGRIAEKEIWDDIGNIPDEELWREHVRLKEDMIRHVNSRIRLGHVNSTCIGSCKTLDPSALTIGFSRRFATYKRAALIFRDIERIKKILNTEGKPVQIIFAGKAHPADSPAQDIIRHINDISEREGFEGKVVLLENYNISLARRLVQSVDVWLNNPRMPLEASGTSGQKAGINGVLNLSVLDGWWREGYNGHNGWAIGSEEIYANEMCQDNADSESLYEILENNLIPAYYERDEKDISAKWISMMKESVRSLAAQFSTHRMVQDYTAKLYVPSMDQAGRFDSGAVRQLVNWKQKVSDNWNDVAVVSCDITRSVPAGTSEKIAFEAAVNLGGLRPEDVSVEFYYGNIDIGGEEGEWLNGGERLQMQYSGMTDLGGHRYTGELTLTDSGDYGYSVRIVPVHPLLSDKFDVKLVKWAEN